MKQIPPWPLWIGNAGDLRDLSRLSALGIRTIIDLALDERPLTPGRETAYLRIPLLDGGGNPPWAVRAAVESLARLLRDQVPTLVLCSGGMSRSPAIAAGALSLVTGTDPSECLRLVIAGGPADLSPGLWAEVEAIVREASGHRR
jgi:hypothetical protein